MIRRIQIWNFRSHEATDLRLEPLSLLVGPAGGGKSNLLKALVLLQNSVHQPLSELFPAATPWEFRLQRSRFAGETDPIGFRLELDIEAVRAIYTLRLADSPQGVFVLEESLARTDNASAPQWVFQRRWDGPPEMGEFGKVDPYEPSLLSRAWSGRAADPAHSGVCFARAVAESLSRTGYYHLEASRLKDTSDDQPPERIGYLGQGLPGFLARLKTEELPRYDHVLGEMRALLPALDQIVVNRVGPDRQGLAMTFKGQRGHINAPDLSDGTMLTLGLLAIAHAKKQPNLLCIEEPETGLHPGRLRWLFERFVELAYPSTGPAVQVLLTTHSPYLVDLFRDLQSSVTVVEQHDGRTSATNLVDIKHRLHDQGNGDPIGHEWATGLFEGL